ncbi:MAG TPA: protein kinase [Pirellulales bacterium]
MRDLSSATDATESLMAELADEYVERLERGELPDIDEYFTRWPGDPLVLRQALAALKLLRLSSAKEAGEVALEVADASGRLGDFQLLREIGRGGMGVVYEAEQHSLGRRVALKLLPLAGMLDPRQLQRFLNEAHAAARLNHPNIIDVIAVGCERGVHFQAMRLIEGPTLADVIEELRKEQPDAGRRAYRGPHIPRDRDHHAERDACGTRDALDPAAHPKSTAPIAGLSTSSPREYFRSVAGLMVCVAQALDYAHQSGVIHRDVKPSNILLDARGKPWVADFGLARVETGEELTMTGDLLGTPRYMSPEQLLGQRGAVDHRTDIYSLGATLYELLTLRPAFSAPDRAELHRRIAVEPPRAPRKLHRSLPTELETIVLKALEKSPADRYRSAGELADDLQRFLDHRPIHARRSRVMAHAKSLWRRHQVLVVAVLSTLLVASVVAGALVWRQWKEAVGQHGLVLARDADLRQRLYAADMKLAHQAWQRGDVVRAQELIDRYADPAGDELREFSWRYLSSLLAARPAPLAVLQPGHGNVYCVQFSPDGKHLAAACGDGHVEVWNVADWSGRHSFPAHQADADCVAFTPDGRTLVSGGEDGWLRLWDVETGELLRSLDAGQKDTLTLAVSPDGRTLAAGGIDGLVRAWQLPEGGRRGEFRASTGRVQHLAFSPDGAKLATAGGDGSAMVVDATTWERFFGLPGQSMAAYAVAFSPAGDQLALGGGSGVVALVDATRGNAKHQFGVRRAQVRAVGFSPSRRLLASAGLSGIVDLWDTDSRSLSAKLHGHERRIWSLSFSPDGELLASGGDDGSVHIWNPNVESGLAQAERAESIYKLKVAADGNRLLTAAEKQKLITWDAATLQRLATVDLPEMPQLLVVSPDGGRFAFFGAAREVWLGNAATGELGTFRASEKRDLQSMALARDGRLLLWYLDHTLDVWDTATQTLLDRRHIGHAPGSLPPATSGDGRLVAVGCNQVLLLYDVDALAPRFEQTCTGQAFFSVALSPDKRMLAAGMSDGSIALYDAATGTRTAMVTGHQHWVDSMVFSPDGRTLASADRGGVLRLWHLATREELAVVRRLDSNGFVDVDFSPDGRTLAASTTDRDGRGHVFVWSTTSAAR